MNIARFLLISVSFVIVAILSVNFYIWSQEFKDTFMYNNDYVSYIMVFVFILAITGIFKWLLKEEMILTKRKPRRRR